jgi:hypothetical protein
MTVRDIKSVNNGNQSVATIERPDGSRYTLKGPSWEGEYSNYAPTSRSPVQYHEPQGNSVGLDGVYIRPLWMD